MFLFFIGFCVWSLLQNDEWKKTFRETLRVAWQLNAVHLDWSRADQPSCCDSLTAGWDFSCRSPSHPVFWTIFLNNNSKKKKYLKQKKCPLSLHKFWQATKRLESDSPSPPPLNPVILLHFGSVSFWHKWANATVLQCWFHASNCSPPLKAILKIPPFSRWRPQADEAVGRLGVEICLRVCVQLRVRIKIYMAKICSLPARAWEVSLVRRQLWIRVDGPPTNFSDLMRLFLQHLLFACSLLRSFKVQWASLQDPQLLKCK